MPVQQGLVLQQARIRVPSRTGLFVMHTAAGVIGSAIAVAISETLKRNTRMTPGARAAVTAGVGLVGGVVVARRNPRIAAGLALGGVAAAAPAGIEAYETAAALRSAPPSSLGAPVQPTEQPTAGQSHGDSSTTQPSGWSYEGF